MAALSKRLIEEELTRRTLRAVKVAGWPLPRTIRIVRLKDAFLSKAVEHFLQLARRQIRHARFLDAPKPRPVV